MKVKNDHRSKFSNLSDWKEEAWKNQGFNGIRTCDLCDTGAVLYQLSYEATHWERGQLIESKVLNQGIVHHQGFYDSTPWFSSLVPFELCFEFLLSILGPKEVCTFLCYEKKKKKFK